MANQQIQTITPLEQAAAEVEGLIMEYSLKTVLTAMADVVSAEAVTLTPKQSEQIRTFLELAAEEI